MRWRIRFLSLLLVGFAVVMFVGCGFRGRTSESSGIRDTDGLDPSWAPDGHRIVFAEHYQL
jgi:hypothetical protein